MARKPPTQPDDQQDLFQWPGANLERGRNILPSGPDDERANLLVGKQLPGDSPEVEGADIGDNGIADRQPAITGGGEPVGEEPSVGGPDLGQPELGPAVQPARSDFPPAAPRPEAGPLEPARIRGPLDGLSLHYDAAAIDADHQQYRTPEVEPTLEGGPFNRNMAAIRLLKAIQARPDPTAATPEEKQILAGYTGWGWAGTIFSNYDTTFRRDARDELHNLLTEEEWKQAAASTVSAFYTPDPIIRLAWDAANRLGFDGGKVLDPSAGTGRYEGGMPDALRPHTAVTAVEIDSISAAITRALYPQSEVIHSGFEDTRLARNSFDLAITNVPFANHKITGSDYTEYNLHDYVTMRATDRVKPGGLLCLLTTRSTLDSQNPQFRRDLSEKVDLVAAYRLPGELFSKDAGAKVVSDLIILRKKDGTPFIGESFTQIGVTPIPEMVVNEKAEHDDRWRKADEPLTGNADNRSVRINEYFIRHPENVIGFNAVEKGRYNDFAYTVMPPKNGTVEEVLRARMGNLPAGVMGRQEVSTHEMAQAAKFGEKEGTYGLDGDNFYQIVNGERAAVDWETMRNYGESFDKPITKPDAQERRIIARSWIALRESTVELLKLENSPESSEVMLTAARAALNQTYDRYVVKYGTLNRPTGKNHLEKARFLEDDPEYPLVLALEDEIKKDGDEVDYVKGKVFRERLRAPVSIPEKANDLEEALNICLGFYQNIDADRVAALLSISPQEAAHQLEHSGRAFLNPETLVYESKEKYLSGNVYLKLKAAQNFVEENPTFQRNVEALEDVQPERIPIGNIYAQLGSRWLPTLVLESFVGEKYGGRYTIKHNRGLNSYDVNGRGDGKDTAYTVLKPNGGFAMSPNDVLTHALNGTEPVIMERVRMDGEWKDVREPMLTQAATLMVTKLQTEFRSWLLTTNAEMDFEGAPRTASHIVEEVYNRTNNSMVEPKYTGEYIPLVGATSYVHRSPHRMSAVSRVLQEQCGLLAHGVGSGKTLSLIVSAMEMRRLGMARRPWIVVQKQTIGQFAREFRRAYPDANIHVANEKNFTSKNRQRFLARAATREYDAVIVTQPQFDLIMASQSACDAYYTEQIAALNQEEGLPYRELEKAKKRIESRLKKMTQAIEKRQDKIMSFEETGADMLFIDEVHAYKRTPIVSKLSRVKGIPNTESQRATSMMVKVRSIQSRFNGRHVVGATGTPLTNTMAEAYVMLNLTSPNILKNYKIDNFDAFAHTFGVKSSKIEHSWSGTWKMVTRFNKFVNGNELITMMRSGFDVRMGNKELGLKVPEIRGGEPEMVIIPPTPSMQQVNQWISRIADTYEEGEKKREFSWIPITAMQAGVAAALDPRLVDPSLPDHPDSKVNIAVRNIAEIYRDTREGKLTQLVFCDRFRPMQTERLKDFVAGGPSDETIDDFQGEEGVDETAYSPEAEEAALVRREEEDYKAGGFNLYHEIKRKLVAGGVPENEIAIIHDFNTDAKRVRLFEDLNSGKVAVLLGSTEKAGVGVNIQERLYAAHHMDPPRMMTPAMVEQRNGRIIRQGNPLPEVRILYYGMQSSMDTGIYQMLETKQKFIVQALMGQAKVRSFDDAADEVVLSMSEMKARLTGDPRVVRKVELEEQIRQMRSDKLTYDNQIGARIRYLSDLRQALSKAESELVTCQKNLPALKAFLANPGFELLIDEKKYTDPKDAEPALRDLFTQLHTDWKRHSPKSSRTVFFNDLPIVVSIWNESVVTEVDAPMTPGYRIRVGSPSPKRMIETCKYQLEDFVANRRDSLAGTITHRREEIATQEKQSTVQEWDGAVMDKAEAELGAVDAELLAESAKKRGKHSNQSKLDMGEDRAKPGEGPAIMVPEVLPSADIPDDRMPRTAFTAGH